MPRDGAQRGPTRRMGPDASAWLRRKPVTAMAAETGAAAPTGTEDPP